MTTKPDGIDLYREWVALTDAKLGQLAPMMKHVPEGGSFGLEEGRSLSWLSTAALRASGSVLLLIEEDRVWDAEIVSRSGFEATMRFCHLLSDRSLFDARHREFETALPEISSMADHEKASRALAALPHMDAAHRAPLEEIMLSPERLSELSLKYPRAERRKLQSEWGITGIIEQMSRSRTPYGHMAGALLHGYAMASHVAHSDHIGVGIIMEREYRSEGRRRAVHDGHVARLLSDQLWFCTFRLLLGYAFVGIDTREIQEAMKPDDPVVLKLSEGSCDFYRCEYGIEAPDLP